MNVMIIPIFISVLLCNDCIGAEHSKVVRPTVCLQNVTTNEMQFKKVYVDQDVLVHNDVLVDKQLLLDNSDCVCGTERCVCPTGPIGQQGPQGIQGPTGITGPVGPVGIEGSEGPEGSAGPPGPEGSAGPPVSFGEYYLFAVRDSNSVGEQSIGNQIVPVELEIAITDGWGVGTGNNFVAPATGLYEIIYEVRCFNSLSSPTTNFNAGVRLARNGVQIANSIFTINLFGGLGYADTTTVRYATLVFLDQGDLLGLLANGGLFVVIPGSDDINAVLVAIYLGNPN